MYLDLFIEGVYELMIENPREIPPGAVEGLVLHHLGEGALEGEVERARELAQGIFQEGGYIGTCVGGYVKNSDLEITIRFVA